MKANAWPEGPNLKDPPNAELPMTADDWIAFIGKLPPNVTACSYNATTGDFSVTLAPTPVAETKRKEKEEPRKVRDTEMISRTAPVFGVEE